MARGVQGGCRGGESDSGEGSRPPRAVTVRRRKEGAAGWAWLGGCRWPGPACWLAWLPPPTILFFFHLFFLFFFVEKKREGKDKNFGVFYF